MVLSMERWKGQVAIVTGASSGIGAAICEKLVEAGVKVVGLARRKEKVEELSRKLQGQPGELFSVKCDMTLENDILGAFIWATEHVGPISILVNNAGIYKQLDLTEVSTADLKKLFDTNVLGLTIATREAVKNMMENKIDGHIIHIGSTAGRKIHRNGLGTYASSKFPVRALTEGLRLDLNAQKSKIKISSVSPGTTDTEILADVPQEIVSVAPKLKSEDVADAVIYVLSTPVGVQVHDLIMKATGEKH